MAGRSPARYHRGDVDADEKLRAGLQVTIPEIVETFCELEEVHGLRVPTDRSIQLIKRRVAEADARGLLVIRSVDD